MPETKAINKVIYGGRVLIDLTGDTITADKLLAGYKAHGADGNIVETKMPGNSGFFGPNAGIV